MNNASAQNSHPAAGETPTSLKTFLIERDIGGAEALTATELKGISQKS